MIAAGHTSRPSASMSAAGASSSSSELEDQGAPPNPVSELNRSRRLTCTVSLKFEVLEVDFRTATVSEMGGEGEVGEVGELAVVAVNVNVSSLRSSCCCVSVCMQPRARSLVRRALSSFEAGEFAKTFEFPTVRPTSCGIYATMSPSRHRAHRCTRVVVAGGETGAGSNNGSSSLGPRTRRGFSDSSLTHLRWRHPKV